jgi:hypothetical protein
MFFFGAHMRRTRLYPLNPGVTVAATRMDVLASNEKKSQGRWHIPILTVCNEAFLPRITDIS